MHCAQRNATPSEELCAAFVSDYMIWYEVQLLAHNLSSTAAEILEVAFGEYMRIVDSLRRS